MSRLQIKVRKRNFAKRRISAIQATARALTADGVLTGNEVEKLKTVSHLVEDVLSTWPTEDRWLREIWRRKEVQRTQAY